MTAKSIQILRKLQAPSGLMMASQAGVTTGYNKAWLRDNVYESLGFEAVKNKKAVVKIYTALLDILLKHEEKIDWAIKEKPDARFKYIHARYDPYTFEEIWGDWGNKQNDAIGAILFKIGELEEKGINIIRNRYDIQILQKLVWYLESIEYWHDKDNGVWEENEEVHASSVGACVAGLRKIGKLVDVSEELIQKGQEKLDELLPRESLTKETDLALLSLIYPYNIASAKQRKQILKNVEENLVRKRGVIRYKDDAYYNKNGEAEWTMGFPWLAIIYKQLNKPAKYAKYMRKAVEVMNDKGEMPELYFSGSSIHNENSPLGWSQALYLAARVINESSK
ncbi:glycoside hydrolase family 15 [Candidatus Woesearchaeota archaeon]|nr:glycoside hydrolase family 15 [Candidatus Woesearchaeota archaeon]